MLLHGSRAISSQTLCKLCIVVCWSWSVLDAHLMFRLDCAPQHVKCLNVLLAFLRVAVLFQHSVPALCAVHTKPTSPVTACLPGHLIAASQSDCCNVSKFTAASRAAQAQCQSQALLLQPPSSCVRKMFKFGSLLLPAAGVDWKVVSRFCDISRSYKTFQNPNDESAPGPTTWKGRLMRVLTLPAFIPQRLRKAPGSVWRTISGGQKDMKLGKNFQPGEQSNPSFICRVLLGLDHCRRLYPVRYALLLGGEGQGGVRAGGVTGHHLQNAAAAAIVVSEPLLL